jgi:8-oxo-dGTP diphosphatase
MRRASHKPFTLSVKALVYDKKGRCLLLKRSNQARANPGKWEFPGGKLDPAESFDQALLREVREETGLTVSLRKVAGAAESELPETRVVYLIMEADVVSGEFKLSEEHTDFQWASSAQIRQTDLTGQFYEFIHSYQFPSR